MELCYVNFYKTLVFSIHSLCVSLCCVILHVLSLCALIDMESWRQMLWGILIVELGNDEGKEEFTQCCYILRLMK
jgi:hypothetical protein